MLTLDETERPAYAAGDTRLTALLCQSEEEFAETVTPEHEAVIDDRNRLRDALTECMERMHDAIEQLDAYNTEDEPAIDIATGERTPLEFAPAFHDAAAVAGEALGECEAQMDDTARERLAKSDATIASLRHSLAVQDVKLRAADDLIRAVRRVVSSYRTRAPGVPVKAPPKWAVHLLETLRRITP